MYKIFNKTKIIPDIYISISFENDIYKNNFVKNIMY